MHKKLLPAGCLILMMFIGSCSKKQQPQGGVSSNSTTTVLTKAPTARVIAVNDKAAKTSVDGRLYYDVDGRRYWKNYNDGKYYLFNKSMYNNPAFKPH